ncbi:unnamed protein product [Timema podura]|uniref:Uncharacterized protein n=1 Tax=Timema podura TaxID=61482 RepID=A0ABN7P7U6_TIMPD|nr:unnamed protein product [Timema podura]
MLAPSCVRGGSGGGVCDGLRGVMHVLPTPQITALERGRKVEELQKRLVESEMLRTRYNRKVTLLKDQLRTISQSADQERTLNEHNHQILREELTTVKQSFMDCQRRENAVSWDSIWLPSLTME